MAMPELEHEELIEMAQAGVDPKVIAEELDISLSSVYRIMQENNIQPPRKQNREERDAEVLKLYGEGERVLNICRALGISTYTLYAILESNDVPRRRSPESNEPLEEQIVEMYQARKSLSTIRRTTGKSTTYIYNVLDRRGIPRHQDREQWRPSA